MRSLLKFHPWSLFCFFMAAAGITMTGQNPVVILLSLAAAVLTAVLFLGARETFGGIRFYAVLVITVTLINPIFSQQGKTVMFELFGRAFTFEALLYGLFQGLMLLAVLYWFRVFSAVFTADRLLFLFGARAPRLALTLSMALRFIPLFRRQAAKIADTQRAMGLYSKGTKKSHVRAVARVFEAVFMWAPENAIDTYDAMLARGFSGKRITSANDIRFSVRDILLIAASAAVFALYLKCFAGTSSYAYYGAIPIFGAADALLLPIFAFFLYPSFIIAEEKIIWKYSILKI